MSAASAPATHGGFRSKLKNSHEVLPDSAPDEAEQAMRQAGAIWAAAYDKTADTLDDYLNYDPRRANNLVGASITLGLSVIMIILMAIVAGYFVSEAPSNGSFTDAINQVEDVGGTAFILLAVALLAVPVVAIVGYFVNSGLGGFISGGTMRR
jgi:hypothetical protein